MRVLNIVLMVNESKNDCIVYKREEPSQSGEMPEYVCGTQAEILDTEQVDVIENVGHPDEIYVDATDISTYLGCSVDTGRRWLKRFQEHGLVKQHGEIDQHTDTGSHYVNLYRPTVTDVSVAMTALYELADEEPPAFATVGEEVTPGDFEFVEGTKATFRYLSDPEVTVDVDDPEEGTIKGYILGQLRENGLVPTSPRNFQHQLRDRAGLL